MKTIPVELLSPAKNAEYGMAAINFGADAVYIGAPKFGARASAGSSIQEIEALCQYAHRFHARVYVALNTILYDHELAEAERLIHQIYQAGADALIIQDMGILEMQLPPIELHASTQANNVDVSHISFLEKAGISRVILARELSLEQIQTIRNGTSLGLEAFVHGALCVCYSGQCYMSAFMGSRSGNRGECAQPCRLPYDVLDKNTQLISGNSHALSLRDMNRSASLSDMLHAGVTAFKIEGRMKDIGYVKNVTAYYRKKLDRIFEQNARYAQSSIGKCEFDFEPDPEKTFNRRYTEYFLNGRQPGITSSSPKSVGKLLGAISEIGFNYLVINTREKINNGDGLCYFLPNGELAGFSVQQTDLQKIFTSVPVKAAVGTAVYRNADLAFTKMLQVSENARHIGVDLRFAETADGFTLFAATSDGLYRAESSLSIEKSPARDEQKALETLETQLRKSGGTCFNINDLKIEWGSVSFIPMGALNQLRRETLEKLNDVLGTTFHREEKVITPNEMPYDRETLDYKANVANALARKFWNRHGVKNIEDAFELAMSNDGRVLMTTKLCLRYEAGACTVHQSASGKVSPEFLDLGGKLFRLEYDCRACEMRIIDYKGE